MDRNTMKAKQARRLAKELENAKNCKNPYIWFRPLPNNQLIWHFTVRGPDKSPYEGGVYHGRIELPDNFPYSAPDFYFMTENGRFRINSKICFNISGYHNESWQAATSIEAMVQMIQVMLEDRTQTGISFIQSSDSVIRDLAAKSVSYRCPQCGSIKDLLPSKYGVCCIHLFNGLTLAQLFGSFDSSILFNFSFFL